MTRSVIIALTILTLVTLVFGTGRLIKHSFLSTATQKEQVLTRDEATPIQEGVMTERQRAHSRLYKEAKRGGRKLSDYRHSVQVVIPTPWAESPDETAPKSTEELLHLAACNADAVVIGVVKNKSSQLTEEGFFIFTYYEMQAEEVLKENPSANTQPGSILVITRPGGAVELNGKTLSVTDKSFKPLEVGGKYLLFLRLIRATGTYQGLNSESSFKLTQNSVYRVTERRPSYPFDYENDATAFVAQVRAAVNICNHAQRGGAE